jgi:hypothetical protein
MASIPALTVSPWPVVISFNLIILNLFISVFSNSLIKNFSTSGK